MTTEFTESEPHRHHVDGSTAAAKASPPRPTITAMPIWNIRVGNRIRRDLGDIDGLAQNIDAIGLLNPLTVWSDGTLLAGARRLAAVKLLGWLEVPVRIMEPANDN
jgi:ParB-like chromosome segregation protein Spo0J